MVGNRKQHFVLSRREFLKTIGWAPAIFLPSSFSASPWTIVGGQNLSSALPVSDVRLTPHYPTKSPLDDLLQKVDPGSDEYVLEKYANEISQLLGEWSRTLKTDSGALDVWAKHLDETIESTPLTGAREISMRAAGSIDVIERSFSTPALRGREPFQREMKSYLAQCGSYQTAEFLVVGIDEIADDPAKFDVTIRYDFVGTRAGNRREQRIGEWRTRWSRRDSGEWRISSWRASRERVNRAASPAFIDITGHALGQTESYRSQMLRGADYWRTILDGACGIDVYGNNGLAVGDLDNDGFDDLYICQPSGLPNRLYRNRGDGTFEDVTEASGVGVLDGTACALFADFENKGVQDLLVVCASGPLLFLNEGKGKLRLKRDAFKFAGPPQGTFTHAAVADYDRDGRLDIYFCLYSYYLGLDQYHYPAPYFDARNGPPNFLLHNEGNATFIDRTAAAGLNVENDRYSFACAWGDLNGDSHPDLYVANDFGRNNLYRNNGDGTFTAISAEARVQDVGAGMSACWFDYDNDGQQDVYVSNMWSPAGLRVSRQKQFHENDSDEDRSLYRQHARGNSLYRNDGNGKFENASEAAGASMGRWAWSADGWDFDHDGYSDLYVANGYISGPDKRDLSSFFWRHVVGSSPRNASPSPAYEQGWNAINELIRSDVSWSGYERNVCYLNNRDGTFSEVSGVVGLDFPDDSRSFVLADLDHDGRQELILKNRNAPQLRIVRNVMEGIGRSVVFRLHGQKSNRDAIGSAVTVETGTVRQTKYLEAGSGFLSQHSKELHFGIGNSDEPIRVTVRWPSGGTQRFDRLPPNHRIEIQEGRADYQATPFVAPIEPYTHEGAPAEPEALPSSFGTWLIEPLIPPDFSLPDVRGEMLSLQSFRGKSLLLCFWGTKSASSCDQVRTFHDGYSAIVANGCRVLSMNVDDPSESQAVRAFTRKEALPFPTLLAGAEVAGIYNILYRYLFDRRRDLPIPATFLIDEVGQIVKLYQGSVNPQEVLNDLKSAPKTAEDRIREALPFPGLLPEGGLPRNDFTYGVAMFQRGYLDQAEESFKQVIAAKPQYAEAHYNLGTLYLRRNALAEARRSLQRAVQLRENYPEAWNNLGMVSAREDKVEDAIRDFERSLELRPDYAVALVNLGDFYRRRGNNEQAAKLLGRALAIEPENPEANYSLGMLYVRQDQLQRGVEYLEKAVSLRPDYADALNNLGVLFVRQQRYPEAEDRLKTCIRVAPGFDQAYLNLARLYVLLDQDDKAKATLQSLLRLQPQHKMAQQALEMLH